MCERDGDGWGLLDRDYPRVVELAAQRDRIAADRHVVGLTVPRASLTSDLAGLVERRLRLSPGTVWSRIVSIDGEDHIVAVWPSVERVAPHALAALVDLVGGELLDDGIESA